MWIIKGVCVHCAVRRRRFGHSALLLAGGDLGLPPSGADSYFNADIKTNMFLKNSTLKCKSAMFCKNPWSRRSLGLPPSRAWSLGSRTLGLLCRELWKEAPPEGMQIGLCRLSCGLKRILNRFVKPCFYVDMNSSWVPPVVAIMVENVWFSQLVKSSSHQSSAHRLDSTSQLKPNHQFWIWCKIWCWTNT